MISVKSPFAQYFELNGEPLDSGYIYFGIENQNPETNPVTVYWDKDGTIPAAQPIRTVSGYISRNGSPAALFTPAAYSVTVRDKNQGLIFTLPSSSSELSDSSSGTSGAGLVGYNYSVTYPANTVGSELTSIINGNEYVVANIAALKLLDKTKYRSAFVSGYYAQADGGGGSYYYDPADTTSTDNGGTIIVASDGGRWKLNLRGRAVTLKQFGAKGDGVANDTVAIQSALTYLTTQGANVSVPTGTYLTDPLTINSTAYTSQASLIGSDRERCIIQRRTAGAGAFITIGSPAGVIFQSGVNYENLTFNGGAVTNGDTFVGYDIVRTAFTNVRFQGGARGCHLFGGVSISFYSCQFDFANIGLMVQKFASAAGGGWPNVIRVIGGEVVDNVTWGVYFDDGRMLTLRDVEVEGNGTALASAGGGVYVGTGIGAEVSASDTYSIGLIADGCWFEANKGLADVYSEGGLCTIRNSNFFSTAAQVTNDINITGGRFLIENINISFAKAANLLEGASTVEGSAVIGSDIPNISTSQAKTAVWGANRISTRDGVVPVFNGYAIPLEQFGSANTTAGATVTITFPVAFASAPRVFTQTANGDTTTQMNNIVISSITTTGFAVRALSLTSGSSTISSIACGFYWRAVGTR